MTTRTAGVGLTQRRPRPPTISTHESRSLLDTYRNDAASANQERQKGAMSTTTGVKRQAANIASIVLQQYEAAMGRKAYDEAISCLLEAIRLGEARHDVFFNVAALLQHKGSLSEAVEYYTRAIRDDPLHGEDYLRRSECYAAMNQAGDAFEELEKYFKLEEPSKALLVKCGKFALDADLLEEAEGYLTRAVAFEADDAPENAANDAYAFFNLGELHERRGDDAKAEECFAEVCKRDPGFPEPYLTQADSEFAEGNCPMALHLYEAVAKIRPDDPSIYLKLADVYEQLGDEFAGSVLSCLTKAVDLTGPSDVVYEPTLVRRGVLQYSVFSSLDDAVADFTVCLDQNPDCSDARLHRATVLRQRDQPGDVLQAVEDYRTAITLDIPWAAKAEPFRYLAQFELEEGNTGVAAQYFALSALWAPMDEKDTLDAVACFATTQAQRGTTSFEEPLEPRNYVVPKDDKARKVMEATLAGRGPAIFPMTYQGVDRVYSAIRAREPTIHGESEYRVVGAWKAYREEAERAREDEAAKNKKGKKK